MTFEPATSQKRASIFLRKIAVNTGNWGYVHYAIESEGIEALTNKYYAGPDSEMLARNAYQAMKQMAKDLKLNITFVNEIDY